MSGTDLLEVDSDPPVDYFPPYIPPPPCSNDPCLTPSPHSLLPPVPSFPLNHNSISLPLSPNPDPLLAPPLSSPHCPLSLNFAPSYPLSPLPQPRQDPYEHHHNVDPSKSGQSKGGSRCEESRCCVSHISSG